MPQELKTLAPGVAKRSLVAAAAQITFALAAVQLQGYYDVWRSEGWGEGSWQWQGGGDAATFAERWQREEQGWRLREARPEGETLASAPPTD